MKPSPCCRLKTLAGLCVALVAALPVRSQQVAPVTPAPEPARKPAPIPVTTGSDETVVLSPFTVSTGADRGYQALNTLSGTRLNSKLEDLGASITVRSEEHTS